MTLKVNTNCLCLNYFSWGPYNIIQDKKIGGVESKEDFLHLTSIKTYKDLEFENVVVIDDAATTAPGKNPTNCSLSAEFKTPLFLIALPI